MGLGTYIQETRAELKHVSWLSRRQTLIYTGIVIGISLGVAIYLGIFDYLFSLCLKFLINNF